MTSLLVRYRISASYIVIASLVQATVCVVQHGR